MTLYLLQLVFREELAVAAGNATLLLSILNLLLKVLVLVLVLGVSGVRLILLMRCLETETRALGLETGLGGTFQLLKPG